MVLLPAEFTRSRLWGARSGTRAYSSYEGGREGRGEAGGAAGAGRGPALQGLERQPAGRRVPDEQVAIEDQPAGELLGGGHRVRPPILDQRPAPGLHQHPPARLGRG